jgi:hypothetical protein
MEPGKKRGDALTAERKNWMSNDGRPKRQRVIDYLLEHPTATNKDVMAATEVSIGTVTNARRDLVKEGRIPPSWGDHKSPEAKDSNTRILDAESSRRLTKAAPPEGSPFDTLSTSDLQKKVEEVASKKDLRSPIDDADDADDEEIDYGKLKKILWRIARRDPDNRIRTSAIWTLTRIQQDLSDRPLGPGKPLTEEAAIERFILLFTAVGPTTVVKALNTYLAKAGYGKPTNEPTASAGGNAEIAGTTGHTGTETEAANVRTLDIHGGEESGDRGTTSLPDHDLSGPAS